MFQSVFSVVVTVRVLGVYLLLCCTDVVTGSIQSRGSFVTLTLFVSC